MEAWEVTITSPGEYDLVRAWANVRPVTIERLDAKTINVYIEDAPLEDALGEMCVAYGLECRLL